MIHGALICEPNELDKAANHHYQSDKQESSRRTVLFAEEASKLRGGAVHADDPIHRRSRSQGRKHCS
jgi:hypothetical protein